MEPDEINAPFIEDVLSKVPTVDGDTHHFAVTLDAAAAGVVSTSLSEPIALTKARSLHPIFAVR